MCFSTARLVSTSESAIAALLLPLRDLGEDLALARRQLGERRALERAPWRAPARRRASGRCIAPPGGHGLDRGPQLRAVVDALLEQVAAAVGPGLQQRERVAGSAYWLSTTTPISGCVSRSSAATRIPSSVLVGGIRMSVTTTSGRSRSIASISSGRSPQEATTSHLGLEGEDLLDALADDQAVIGQGDGNGHAETASRIGRPHAYISPRSGDAARS